MEHKKEKMVTLSFIVTDSDRRKLRMAAAIKDQTVSEFLRDFVKNLK